MENTNYYIIKGIEQEKKELLKRAELLINRYAIKKITWSQLNKSLTKINNEIMNLDLNIILLEKQIKENNNV